MLVLAEGKNAAFAEKELLHSGIFAGLLVFSNKSYLAC
jgi:hypothetical protein